MSARLDALLRAEMERWESRGLRRDLDAQARVNVARECEFTSNDYLSLANDPRVIEAARAAIDRHGAGGRAARLLGGGCELDRRAEASCAEWMSAESALLFPSGYQANAGLLGALAPPGAAIFSDRLNHASIIDAARLSRARTHVYEHCDLEQLAALLSIERAATRRIVVTESVFSMDGDLAPLARIHELCVRHDAFLIVDEAHAVGLIGRRNAGAWSEVDIDGGETRLAARLVTGGKALGVSGAFVVGSRALREHLANRARSFVFTTALSPAISGALCASIAIARHDTQSSERARATARTIASSLRLPPPAAAIVPFVVGDSTAAVKLATALATNGLDVRAVRPPTVPEGSARLRIACHAHNSNAAVDALITRLRSEPEREVRPVEVAAHARTLFVVGTDTDVGKTVVSALVARAASRRGPATYWKPVQTGTASDTQSVRELAGDEFGLAQPLYEFALPASPHTAARAEQSRIEFDRVRSALATLSAECRGTLIVELAGGLMVPYDDERTQADFVELERPDVVLVARSGLGTLNHTLLTLEALAARSVVPLALFLVGPLHEANARTLRERTGLKLFELELDPRIDSAALDAWIERNDMEALFP